MTAVNYDWDEDEDNIVEEFDDAGTTIAEYTTEVAHFGNLISQRRSGQDSYFHFDGQGSTLAVTDASGSVTDSFSYSAFGEPTWRSGSTTIPFQYIGQKGYYNDVETGEYEVRRRPYAPDIDRWLSLDAINAWGVANAYTYCLNNPTYWIDCEGMDLRHSNPGDDERFSTHGCRWEKHHWFPQELRPEIEAKCAVFGFNVDIFTTYLRRCWGKYLSCDAHGWLHSRRTPKWNPQVLNILRSSRNCCDFLVQMYGAITGAYGQVTALFDKDKCYRPGQTHDPLEFVHYNFRNSSPELTLCTPIQTGWLFLEIVSECKKQKNEDSKVKSRFPDLQNMAKAKISTTGNADPDYVFTFGIVGGAAFAPRCIPMAVEAAKIIQNCPIRLPLKY